jgi:hypothetical protein
MSGDDFSEELGIMLGPSSSPKNNRGSNLDLQEFTLNLLTEDKNELLNVVFEKIC